jgi:hypothetical protein
LTYDRNLDIRRIGARVPGEDARSATEGYIRTLISMSVRPDCPRTDSSPCPIAREKGCTESDHEDMGGVPC